MRMPGKLGVLVLPDQVAVPKRFEASKSDGLLRDPKQQAGIERLAARLAGVLEKLLA
jgi:chromate reductase, NAD(P)H dehydrogenase (quinone)